MSGSLIPPPIPTGPAARLLVITVTRNDLAGLRTTYDSLCLQTAAAIDWVVVDGGSDDGTPDWLAVHENAIAWWYSAPDFGVYDGMNRALVALEARLRRRPRDGVLFLNAGDAFVAKDTASAILHQLNTSSAGLIYGDALEYNHLRTASLKKARSHRLAILGMFTHHQSMVYRSGLIVDARYDLTFPIGADYDFTLSLLRRCSRVDRLDLPVSVFRGNGLSWQHSAQGRRDQARIREGHYQIATLWNNIIFILQWAIQVLRTLFPSTYAYFRFKDFGH